MAENTEIDPRGGWTSASNALQDELCPGRHEAQRGLKSPPSDDASFGTAIHLALEKQNPEGLTTEQESIYESCSLIEKKVLAVFYPGVAGVVEPPIRERRLFIKWANGLQHSGQVDVAHVIGYRALIGEIKSLPGDIPTSPNNLQLRDQAVLLATNIPGLKEIGVYVNQPLVTHSPEITIYQVADLDRARDDLYRRVAASNTKGAPRVAGELQCKFCLARSTCPDYGHWVGSALMQITGSVSSKWEGATTVKTDSGIVLESRKSLFEMPVESWSPAMRTLFMECVKSVEDRISERKEQLREMLIKDPNAIPGFTLKEGRNNPTIINPGAVFANFKAKGGTEADFLEAVVVGKGKLAEALKKVTKLKGNALEKATEACIGSNVTVTKNRPSIVKSK